MMTENQQEMWLLKDYNHVEIWRTHMKHLSIKHTNVRDYNIHVLCKKEWPPLMALLEQVCLDICQLD